MAETYALYAKNKGKLEEKKDSTFTGATPLAAAKKAVRAVSKVKGKEVVFGLRKKGVNERTHKPHRIRMYEGWVLELNKKEQDEAKYFRDRKAEKAGVYTYPKTVTEVWYIPLDKPGGKAA